ncbi:hypothetical protein FAVG1_12156 [Fusarium avenaceum]|nr:hypothetical protein FAVG1_12156 [Fusarium avenaceum]
MCFGSSKPKPSEKRRVERAKANRAKGKGTVRRTKISSEDSIKTTELKKRCLQHNQPCVAFRYEDWPEPKEQTS